MSNFHDDPHFARFWNAYPKRVAKKDARKAWAQVNPDDATVERIMRALEWQCRQPGWLKDGGQFIPYPASWLRAERWADEPIRLPQLTDKTARTLAAAAAFVKGGS